MNRPRFLIILIILAPFILLATQVAYSETIPGQSMLPVNPGLAADEVQDQLQEIMDKFTRLSSSSKSEDKESLMRALPNSNMFVYVLDAMQANEFGLTMLAGKDSNKYTIIIQEYSIYRDDINGKTGKPYRFGIGVRMLIVVRERITRLNTLSIAAITAQAEKRNLESQIRLEVIGISGKFITEATPMPSELTFTTLMTMYQSIDRIKAAIWDDDTLVCPQILAYGR